MKEKTSIFAFVIGAAVAATSFYGVMVLKTESLNAKVAELQSEVISKTDELLGYTKYTDYLYAGKKQLHEQMRFLAASVVREEGFTRVVNKKILGLTSDSTVAVWYVAEYSFGYDLKPDDYEVTKTATGINIQLRKPILVSSPAAKSLRHKILSGGIFTDDKAAVINLYEGIEDRMKENARLLASEEAVIALCEKKLVAFFQDFLAKQPGVKQVPSITVTYKS